VFAESVEYLEYWTREVLLQYFSSNLPCITQYYSISHFCQLRSFPLLLALHSFMTLLTYRSGTGLQAVCFLAVLICCFGVDVIVRDYNAVNFVDNATVPYLLQHVFNYNGEGEHERASFGVVP
jgi:hypothetical protein